MTISIRWMTILALLTTPSLVPAQPDTALAALPIASTQPVAAAGYKQASALAARGGAPIEIALKVVGPFEGTTQQLIQLNERGESPTASRVTVLRDGFLDDSVRGDRWDIALERTKAGAWRIVEVKRAWRCRRGMQAEQFAAVPCP